MNILHVTRQFLPVTGGIQQAIYHLAHQQLNVGIQADVLTLNRSFYEPETTLPAHETVDGIEVYRIPYKGSPRYAVAPGALRMARRYDLLHIHSTDFFLDYLTATRFIHRTPMVLTSHGLFFHTDFAKNAKELYFKSVTRVGLKGVKAIVCVSEQDYQTLLTISPAEKLHQIPNGIDYARLAQIDQMSRDADLLLAIGGLSHRKRYDRMLRAFVKVLQKRPATRLTIVGADMGLRATLMALAGELGVAEAVTFAGEVSNDEVAAYLARASVFLAASEYEAFGIAAVEAAVAGCTPVLQPLPSYRQLFGPVEKTVFADYDDSDVAAEQICHALAIPSPERKKMIEEYRLLFQPYAWSQIAAQTNQLYVDIVSAETSEI